MSVLHFRIKEHSLSLVSERAWKSVRQLRPWTSSMHNLTFLKAWSSSLFKSARLTSKTRPFNSSVAIFVPVVRVTRVLPQLRVRKGVGALMSYHSFFRKMSPCFFLPPLLPPPLLSFLFLPTAMVLVPEKIYL